MKNFVSIRSKITPFDKVINVPGDKSISIRWVLLASRALGKSKAFNLLESEDVKSAIKAMRKLGVKIIKKNNFYEINGFGLQSFNKKKNIIIDAGNSGTLARLICGLLSNYNQRVKIVGDKSLSKRDFFRVIKPLEKFGAKLDSNRGKLPIKIQGTDCTNPIKYFENKGSAQCKSAVMLAALNTTGQTIIKAKKSRDHSELLFKYLKIPIKIIKRKKFDIIKIIGKNNIPSLNYKIPSDISSAAFFIVLTALSKNSSLKIKNVNINPSRMGVFFILKLMGIKISKLNIKNYKGEKIADLIINSTNKIKPINCPTKFNSLAIDEFLLIFLVAAKANGVSYFKNLSELNQKESPRLKWGSKILNKMGIKNDVTENSIKIFGNPNLKIDKKIIIKDYLKDHRVFMTSIIAALSFGGNWKIYDKNCFRTSFPNFLKIINDLRKK